MITKEVQVLHNITSDGLDICVHGCGYNVQNVGQNHEENKRNVLLHCAN